MIKIQNISMHYGSVRALDGVSFEAAENQILGLLGPNGAGKSTLMKILTTFIHPTGGTVRFGGVDVKVNPLRVREQVGYLPETAPLYPDMCVDEYLRFVGRARGIHANHLAKRTAWVIEACGIGPVLKHNIFELSKGFRQRLGLAQALIHDPKVLILDEPTSGLDPLQIMDIRRLVRELARSKTVIFSTHVLQEVEALADRIVILHEGKMIAEGTREELSKKVSGDDKHVQSVEQIFISLLAKS